MDKSIVITVPHDLGADAAKNRVAKEIERLRTDYLDKVARSEINWSGNKADMRVSALGQTSHCPVRRPERLYCASKCGCWGFFPAC